MIVFDHTCQQEIINWPRTSGRLHHIVDEYSAFHRTPPTLVTLVMDGVAYDVLKLHKLMLHKPSPGDEMRITVEGPDEEELAQKIKQYVEDYM